MLVLTRKVGESIVVGDQIEITVVEVKGEYVRVSIKAPREIGIFRKEIYDEIAAENSVAAKGSEASLEGLEKLIISGKYKKGNKKQKK